MKRDWSHVQAGSTDVCCKANAEVADKCDGQIFSIARTTLRPMLDLQEKDAEGETSHDEYDPTTLKVRVGVSSKVNFTKLSTKEKYMRYHNQASEIKRLRKSLKKYSSGEVKKSRPEVLKAMDKLKAYKPDVEDQADLVANLTHALTSGKLVPNTLGYNQICTILRDSLALTYPDCKYHIRLPETTVAVSSQEYSQYCQLPCTAEIYRLLVGRKPDPKEEPEQLLLSLHRQRSTSHSSDSQGTPTHFH